MGATVSMQTGTSIRMDSTMVTELEYLNMLPADLSKVNESSFLKGMQNDTTTFGGKL